MVSMAVMFSALSLLYCWVNWITHKPLLCGGLGHKSHKIINFVCVNKKNKGEIKMVKLIWHGQRLYITIALKGRNYDLLHHYRS